MSKSTEEPRPMQALCVNMPNNEPEGHYWTWVTAPRSLPNQYRECMTCGRIDASEWLDKRVEEAHSLTVAGKKIKFSHTAVNGDMHLFIDGYHNPDVCPECIQPGLLVATLNTQTKREKQ